MPCHAVIISVKLIAVEGTFRANGVVSQGVKEAVFTF